MPDKPAPGSAADWLRHAWSDLSLASAPLPAGVMYNDLCFHAQQAVEKSIKAVLVHYGVEFRKVHNLDYLVTLLPPNTTLPPEVEEVLELNSYSVMSRYPGDYEEITEEEYRAALNAASRVYQWAEKMIQRIAK